MAKGLIIATLCISILILVGSGCMLSISGKPGEGFVTLLISIAVIIITVICYEKDIKS